MFSRNIDYFNSQLKHSMDHAALRLF